MSVRSPDAPRGRPRSAERDAALIAATQRLLAEEGYDLLSMGAVAEAAGASKNTLYRRWPDKRSLVVDAVAAIEPDPRELPSDALPLRAALLELLRVWREGELLRDRIVVGLISAALRDAELRSEFHSALRSTRSAALERVIQRAVDRGEIERPPSFAPFARIVNGLELEMFVRAGRGMTEAETAEVIDEVLLPLLRGTPAPG